MKLTYASLQLIPFFLPNTNITPSFPKETTKIMEILFQDILQANQFLKKIKKKVSMEVFDITIKNIENIYHISKPKNFPWESLPSTIRQDIHENSLTEICYSFSLLGREIKLYFIIEDSISDVKLLHYQQKVDVIILWLFILNKYASKKCSKYLTVYFYFTSLTKNLPFSNTDSLKEDHVNTAFTSTCPSHSEIIIYRKEEWLKVFIHETFHNFALDFSDMNSTKGNEFILDLFPVDSEVNLYEAYTEFWAELINCCLASFYQLKEKENFPLFLSFFHSFIELERKYSCFQLVKVLDFMGLTYSQLWDKKKESYFLRKTKYREKTNVLSYYVIKTILLFNYKHFLSWCFHYNTSLLQFNKTDSNLMKFCDFIYQCYQNKAMIRQIKEMEKYLNLLKNENLVKIGKKEKKMIVDNLRMSICELG